MRSPIVAFLVACVGCGGAGGPDVERAVAPAQAFAAAHPSSTVIRSADGTRVVHASGFTAGGLAPDAEAAARAFLAADAHGPAFGLSGQQVLSTTSSPEAGNPGAVRFARTIDGLPVFGGDLVVGVDARNQVLLVNSADVPATVSGSHALGEAAAAEAALSSFGRAVRDPGPPAVVAGWRAAGGAVRAVYRVDFTAGEPAGDWRVFVDGETGAALFREDLRFRATAQASVYEVSPVETTTALCPISGGGGRTVCAAPATVTLPNLATTSNLLGNQVSVYDCSGANEPTTAAGVPGTCTSPASVGGAFNFTPDGTYRLLTDPFAAVMAYYHLDRQVSFFKSLTPNVPGGTGRAVRASIPALVNVRSGGAAFENAYFSGLLDAMVFGQGAVVDYAYDATVAYHELTHGVVFAWGGFSPDIDALGGLAEPRAVNEGTADALASAMTGRSVIGAFIGTKDEAPAPALRDMSDPSASRSCQGNGTVKANGFINGLNGEVHDDGGIWNGFYWEVYQGLEAAGIKGCSGTCAAGPALQYQAVQLAGGTSPTFASYWQTMKSAATALFPSVPGVAKYVDCVGRRRGMDRCDRTVPVYAGEGKDQYIDQLVSSFQVVVDVTVAASARLNICSALGSETILFARKGAPVQIDVTTSNVTADKNVRFTQSCPSNTVVSFPSAGKWYLLLNSATALVGQDPGYDYYRIAASASGISARPAAAAVRTCALERLTITPASPTVPPLGSLALAVQGAGTGFAWSFEINASGGTIDASTGAYRAGPTGNVTDIVRVVNSTGDLGTVDVNVTAAITVSPAAATAKTGGKLAFTATGGSGQGYAWSLATNASGGNVDGAAGAYTAGRKGSVTDVVQVADSLGNTATASVTVTGGGGGGGGCGIGDVSGFSALLLAAASLLATRRRGARRTG